MARPITIISVPIRPFIPSSPQCSLHVLHRAGTLNCILILVWELYTLLMQPTNKVSRGGFSHKVKDTISDNPQLHYEELEVPATTLAELKRMGVVGQQSKSKLLVFSPAMMERLLTKCSFTKQEASEIRLCITNHTQNIPTSPSGSGMEHHYQQALGMQLQAGASPIVRAAMANSTYPSLAKFQVFPSSLPELPPSDKLQELGMQFGLGHAINTNPATAWLKQQLAHLQQHLTSPINAFREGKHLQPGTMSDYLNTLYSYFGVVHKLMGVPLNMLSLWDVACPSQLAMFLTVQLHHKQVVQGTIAMQGSRLLQVLQYLQLHTTSAPEKEHLAAVVKWLTTIKGQVVDLAALPRKLNMQQLPSLAEVVYLQEQHINKQVAAFEAYIADPLPYTIQQQQDILWGLHDACLFGLMYGYLPPTRLLAITTAKHPRHSASPCTQCQQVGCTGNSICQAADNSYTIKLVHHKVANTSTANTQQQAGNRVRCSSSSIGAQPLQCPVPHGLQHVLHLWATKGWGMVKSLCLSKEMSATTSKLLFWDPNSEQGFTDKVISTWFKRQLVAAGIPEEKVFCPQSGRHLWVTTMKVKEAANEYVPNPRGQAHILGHNPQQWNAPIYNLYQKQLEVQQAAQGMPTLRHELLMEHQEFMQMRREQARQEQQADGEEEEGTSFYSCGDEAGEDDTATTSNNQRV